MAHEHINAPRARAGVRPNGKIGADRYIKIGVTAAVLILTFTGMIWSTLREGTEYYKNVDEVMNNAQPWEGKHLQLHGYVVPGSIYRARSNSLEWKFRVQNNPARHVESGGVVEASYTGIVPDTFKDEAEVVLKGQLSPDHKVFHTDPNGVMAKCPSKYEPQSTASGS
jgi:cytochrome c-type biogenesis protein CcmE